MVSILIHINIIIQMFMEPIQLIHFPIPRVPFVIRIRRQTPVRHFSHLLFSHDIHRDVVFVLESQSLLHSSESNESSVTITGGTNTSISSTGMTTNTNQGNRSSVYNSTNHNSNSTANNNSTGSNVSSPNPRSMNNNTGQKRRIPASHNNMNSYVNNLSMSKLTRKKKRTI